MSFDKAADYIEKNGLHKGEYYPGFSGRGGHISIIKTFNRGELPMCIMGAVIGAFVGDMDRAAIYRVEEELGNHSAARWNDDPFRTKEEVVQLLRNLAAS